MHVVEDYKEKKKDTLASSLESSLEDLHALLLLVSDTFSDTFSDTSPASTAGTPCEIFFGNSIGRSLYKNVLVPLVTKNKQECSKSIGMNNSSELILLLDTLPQFCWVQNSHDTFRNVSLREISNNNDESKEKKKLDDYLMQSWTTPTYDTDVKYDEILCVFLSFICLFDLFAIANVLQLTHLSLTLLHFFFSTQILNSRYLHVHHNGHDSKKLLVHGMVQRHWLRHWLFFPIKRTIELDGSDCNHERCHLQA